MRVSRFDTGKLGKVERTPQGGIRVEAVLTRSGLLRYANPDGSTRVEYRPQSEVERADSLASLRDAPVTNLHHGMIDASNWRRAAVGSLSGEARMDGDKVVASLAIQDDYTIGLIESGERREVSCGYGCRLDHTPGTFEGERYDAVQRDIVYNHVALVPRGRAGREVALRLDADDNQIGPEWANGDEMKIEIIGGTEYEVGTAAHRKAVQVRQDAEDAVTARLDAAKTLEAENTKLKAENAKLRERLDAAPKDMETAVRERIALMDLARKAEAAIREDMSDDEIRRAVIGKTHPDMELDGKSEAYVSAAFDISRKAIEASAGSSHKRAREDAYRAARGNDDDETREDGADGLPPDERSRRKMIGNLRKVGTRRSVLDKS